MSVSAVRSGRRSRRDWLVDGCLFLFAVGYGTVLAWLVSQGPRVPRPALVADQVAGAVACAALWLRRRWPAGLALALAPVAAVADFASGAQLVALFTVAVHRPGRVTAAVGAVSLCCGAGYTLLHPPRDLTAPWIAGIVMLWLAVSLAVIGWGVSVRHRRQLEQSRRERAARAASEARLRAQQIQYEVRAQVAREMHDVLGHRLSLLSVHAGALEFCQDAPHEEVARGAAVIRASAHQALQDLREVIHVLRAPEGELPQPTMADLPGLVTGSVRAGMRVRLTADAEGTVPDSVGRTAFRIVQEGLTNARKHAPGAAVTVRLTGAPGDGLTVEVLNPPPPAPAPGPPPAPAPGPPPGPVVGPPPAAAAASPPPAAAAGQGLVGLAERVALAAGRLEHCPTRAGGFRLSAWLPWPE